MWQRSELKTSAKQIFKKNYWKFVLLGLIFTIVSGQLSGVFSIQNSANGFREGINSEKEFVDKVFEKNSGETLTFRQIVRRVVEYSDIDEEQREEVLDRIDSASENEFYSFVGKVIVLIFTIMIFTFIVATLIDVFVLAPFRYGVTKSLIRSSKEGNVCFGEVVAAFKNHYGKIVGTLFLRELFIFLWSLLFVIPGIVKTYEYRMVEFLLANDPEMTRKEAFAKSKEMMRGNKWKAFVLDLSFIGWILLAGLTFGILALLWVVPYIMLTDTQLFFKLYELTYGKGDKNDTLEVDNDVIQKQPLPEV